MSQTLDKQQTQLKLDQLNDALSSGTFLQVRRMLNSLSGPNIATLLESSPPKNRNVIWQLVDKDREGEIFPWLNDEIQSQFLKHMDPDRLAEMADELDDDDIADILQNLPDTVIEEVLSSMSEQDRHRVEQMLSYDEDTAGGLMNTDTITIHPRVTLDEVVARRPDVVLLPDEPHAFSEADAEVFRKLDIPAAKSGRIVFCDGKDLMWYGARSFEGLERLRAILSGEAKS